MLASNAAKDEVHDSRRGPRFIVDPPITAAFNGAPVQIYNMAERGLQIELPARLTRTTYGTIRFALPLSPRVIELEAWVAWCRQARQADPTAAWPYRCGLRVAISALTVETLSKLLHAKVVRPDRDSLERKKRLVGMRRIMGPGEPAPPAIPPPVTLEDAITRVRAARAELKNTTDTDAIYRHLSGAVERSIISVVIDLYP